MPIVTAADYIRQTQAHLAYTWHLQEQADLALMEGRFNFRAAADRILNSTFTVGNLSVRLTGYDPTNAEDTFFWFWDLFYEDILHPSSNPLFYAVLEAGLSPAS